MGGAGHTSIGKGRGQGLKSGHLRLLREGEGGREKKARGSVGCGSGGDSV